MTRKRFRKLYRAAITKCHEINLAPGGAITYRPGNTFRSFPRPSASVSYDQLWAALDSVLPVTVGK